MASFLAGEHLSIFEMQLKLPPWKPRPLPSPTIKQGDFSLLEDFALFRACLCLVSVPLHICVHCWTLSSWGQEASFIFVSKTQCPA